MADTKIEWAKKVWNVATGCTKVSAGCRNCYAARMSKRLAGRYGYPADDPFRVTLQPQRLHEPLSWRKPRRVFVCSMGDLFHKDVPDRYIDWVFGFMNAASKHTYIILTKRAERMMYYLKRVQFEKQNDPTNTNQRWQLSDTWRDIPAVLPNVWIGVSAENQAAADERIPLLLQTPAAVRFVSVEPMLEYIDLDDYLDYPIVGWQSESDPYDSPIYQLDAPRLDWVICGSESGTSARPFDTDWARSLKDQCENFEIPFFLKQMPVDGKLTKMPFLDGRQWEEYPTCASG